MGERTEGSITIDATPKEILDVITDFASYPDWVEGIRSAEVRLKDDEGRAAAVAFSFSTMGLSADYTLSYAYAPNDGGVSWTTLEVEGAVKDIQGEYVLEGEPEGEGTRVTYRLELELSMPVPGILRRQGEKRAVKTALEGLKRRVEGA